MENRVVYYAKRHLSFAAYKKIDKLLEWLVRVWLLIRLCAFSRTKEGRYIQTFGRMKWNGVIRNTVNTIPYLVGLAIMLSDPLSMFDATHAIETAIKLDNSAVMAFYGAMLAIAGVFLTLFYTSALSVYASKYPRSSRFIVSLYMWLWSCLKNKINKTR